jgi:DNA-directed RNA polymerase specialized sigma24 family protein
MARYRFWIHRKDKKGQPLDEDILKAAEELAPTLTRYRQQEIDCESASNDMLRSAVEAASKATRKNRIANPCGYLTSIYKRIVDKVLDHDKKLVPVDDVFLENLANTQQRTPSFEELMHKRLVLEKIVKAMDPDTRRIYHLRMEGYSESEIANVLRTTANAISVRFTRGLKKAATDVRQGNRTSKVS